LTCLTCSPGYGVTAGATEPAPGQGKKGSWAVTAAVDRDLRGCRSEMYQACFALQHARWCPHMTIWWGRRARRMSDPRMPTPRVAFGCRCDLTHVRGLIDKKVCPQKGTCERQGYADITKAVCGGRREHNPLIFATSKVLFSAQHHGRFTESL
jgi:hypothetical protein